VHVTGDLDHLGAPGLRSVIADLIDKGHERIVLDLSEVAFIDSGGMSAVMFAIKRLSAIGGKLYLADCSPQVIHKLEIGGLTRIENTLIISPTVEQAVQDSRSS
jgi:anti-sigma B factor antagonist